MLAGLTASASASTSGGKMCGMSCAWMAIIETAFSLVSEPSALEDSCARQAVAGGGDLLDLDEVALFGAVEIVARDGHLGLAALDRLDAETAVVQLARARRAPRRGGARKAS